MRKERINEAREENTGNLISMTQRWCLKVFSGVCIKNIQLCFESLVLHFFLFLKGREKEGEGGRRRVKGEQGRREKGEINKTRTWMISTNWKLSRHSNINFLTSSLSGAFSRILFKNVNAFN